MLIISCDNTYELILIIFCEGTEIYLENKFERRDEENRCQKLRIPQSFSFTSILLCHFRLNDLTEKNRILTFCRR